MANAPWPIYDPVLAADEEVVLPVQVNGKRRAEIRACRRGAEEAVRAIALADEGVRRHLEGQNRAQGDRGAGPHRQHRHGLTAMGAKLSILATAIDPYRPLGRGGQAKPAG